MVVSILHCKLGWSGRDQVYALVCVCRKSAGGGGGVCNGHQLIDDVVGLISYMTSQNKTVLFIYVCMLTQTEIESVTDPGGGARPSWPIKVVI